MTSPILSCLHAAYMLHISSLRLLHTTYVPGPGLLLTPSPLLKREEVPNPHEEAEKEREEATRAPVIRGES